MAVDVQIEERLTAVEEAVRELQRRLTILPPAENWLEKISGSFKDEPEFEKVLEYGRAIREADRPHGDYGSLPSSQLSDLPSDSFDRTDERISSIRKGRLG